MLDITDTLIVDNYLRAYLNYINKYQVLTKQQLINLYKNNKLDEIFLHNLRLVPFIAKRYSKKRGMLSFMDLIQEGNLGLQEAIKSYNYNLNTEFSTYAVFKINQKITRAIATQSQTINYTYGMYYKSQKYQQANTILKTILGRNPTKEEIASETNLSIKQINDVINHSIYTTNIEDALTEKIIIENTEDNLIDKVFLDKLLKYAKLSKKELEVLLLYYFEERPVKEISLKYNCTRQNIECILKTTLSKLKECLNEVNSPRIDNLKNINLNNFYYYLKTYSLKQNTIYFRNFSDNLIETIFNYASLTKQEQHILSLLLGINQYQVLSYKEIANLENYRIEEVKQIGKSAMKKIALLVKVLHPEINIKQ